MTIVISLNDFENTYIQVHVTCQTRGLLFKASVVFRKKNVSGGLGKYRQVGDLPRTRLYSTSLRSSQEVSPSRMFLKGLAVFDKSKVIWGVFAS